MQLWRSREVYLKSHGRIKNKILRLCTTNTHPLLLMWHLTNVDYYKYINTSKKTYNMIKYTRRQDKDEIIQIKRKNEFL